MSRTIRIGNGAGFWGDNLDAPRLLAEAGALDYLTLEYLAELTLSILTRIQQRQPDQGYITNFPDLLESLVPSLTSQPQFKIVTNAGGLNPVGCTRAAARKLVEVGLGHLRIAAVSGDNLFPRVDELLESGEAFTNFDTGKSFETVRSQLVSANAYLGSAGIVEGLARGARMVITGRVADASLTVGPAVHEFAWDRQDWDRLAAASVAGHLLECGAQATGGMYSAWTPDLKLANVGYPIAELTAAGEVTLSKAAGTDGRITPDTVAEQLIYEIGDPAHYLTPDVDVDFRNITLQSSGQDRVAVTGAAGQPAPERLKVSMAYRDGFMGTGTLVVYGPDCVARAQACGQQILQRVKRAGYTLARTNIECLGAGDVVPGVLTADAPPEVVLRVTAHDPDVKAIDRFCREFAPMAGSGVPGVTGYTGPRSKPWPVLAYWPTTISREQVSTVVDVKTAAEWAAD